MNNIAIMLVVLSAVMHALRNFFTKKAYDKQAFVWWYEVFGQLFFSPVFAVVLFSEGLELSISLYLVLVSGFVHFVYWYFLAKSLDLWLFSNLVSIHNGACKLCCWIKTA